jgi:phosphoenolpyruvate carboxylase
VATSIAQNADIRYLGRLLGDVIRAYGGDALFERIEHIRATSVDRYRGIAGASAVDRGLDALSLDDTLAFVRGFMLFSMLANLAEDRQAAAHHDGDDVATALQRLADEGIGRAEVIPLLDRALIVPVLTAHPTEVMRKSMLDHRNRIAELMRLRDLGRADTRDGDVIEEAILRQIALLWQTRPLRRERLYVADEVEIALAYFRDMLLPALPALYARWERILADRPPGFLRLGSWIGGDRDGNPNVTADSLRLAMREASQTVIAGYLDQVHALGADLSISTELATPTDAVLAMADGSGDVNAARRDEPYRRALSGIYARLAATYQRLSGRSAPRPASMVREPYDGADQFRADLVAMAHSLSAAGAGLLATGGSLGRLIRGVETCGFHLATLDLRQNADVHARVVAELLKVAGVEADYAALDEDARVSLLRRELASQRPLASPYVSYSEETSSELEIVRAAAAAHATYGTASITTYIVSKCDSVSDLLEVNVLLKEAGLYRPSAGAALVMAVPLFETIVDLANAPAIMRAWLTLPEVAAAARSRGYQEVMGGYSDSDKDGGYLTRSGAYIRPRQALAHWKTTDRDAGLSRPGQRRRRGGGSSLRPSAQPAGAVRGGFALRNRAVIAAKPGRVSTTPAWRR